MAKDKDYKRLIHTMHWQRLRHDKLSDCPLCERCKEQGHISAATEVHHVIPVETGLTKPEKERLMFDYTNLKALCHDCHVQIHTAMGRSGKAHAQRRAREQLERFRGRFLPGPDNEDPPGVVF